MKYVVDIDGILCSEDGPFKDRKPIQKNIIKINKLHSKGNKIILFTSRRQTDRKVTLKWLKDNNINFDKLITNKPLGDFYIDDRHITL
jgi:ribonucleotide monophosphatase NagD (HAD superfamily)